MTINFETALDKKTTDNIDETIFGYFKKVDFKKKEDIQSVAQILLTNFDKRTTLSNQEFKATVQTVESTETIAPETKASLISGLESA